MAKAKNKYENVVFANKELDPKNSLDKAEKIEDNGSIIKQVMSKIKEETVVEFNPTAYAHVQSFNEKSKKWELITVAIDTTTNRTELFRKELTCDNENSAVMEMQKQYAADTVARINKRRKLERQRG